MGKLKHTPGPWQAMRADEHDRENGRLHLRSVIIAPPLSAESDPETVAYVDAEGDTALFLAAPELRKSCEDLLALVAHAIVHGMPVTKHVAEVRNAACAALNKADGK